MREHLFTLSRDVLLYGGGQVLNRMVGFLLLPLFTSVLSTEDYGASAMINVLATVIGGLFGLGIGNGVARCYFDVESQIQREKVVWTGLIMIGLSVSLWTPAVVLVSEDVSRWVFHSGAFSRHITLAFIASGVTMLVDPINTVLRITKRSHTFVVLTAINTTLTAALSVLFIVVLRHGLLGMFEAAASGATISSLCVLFVGLRWARPSFDVRHIMPLVRIGFPLIASVLGALAIEYSDRYFIERLIGLSEVGIYSVGYTFGSAILIVANAFYASWPGFSMPFVERQAEAIHVFGKILSYYTIAVGSLCVVFFLAAKPLVYIMTAEPFHSAYTVIGLIAFGYFLKGGYQILVTGLVFSKRSRVQAFLEMSGAILNICLNLLLIPVFRKEGAALATVGAYLSMCCIGWYLGMKDLPVRYEWERIAVFMVICSIVVALSYIQLPSLFLTMVAHSCYLILLGIIAWLFVLTAPERTELMRLLPRRLAYG
jgi:O-antigen/teichoic acid export membrane protein